MMITLRQAHTWLNLFNEDGSYLGLTMRNLVDEANKAVGRGDYVMAWSYVERLPKVSDGYGVMMEMAEARVETACVVYKMGYLHKSAELLTDAAGRYYSYSHHHGVVLWMLGCVLWQLSGRECDAITAWRNSIRIFESIPKNIRFVSEEEIVWYGERVDEMRRDLNQAIENRAERIRWIRPEEKNTPSEDDASPDESEVEEEPPPSNVDEIPDLKNLISLREGDVIWQREGSTKDIPYLGKIRAGEFDHRGIVELMKGNADIHQMLNKGYRCFSLTEDRQIKILESSEYYLLEVWGHSMNYVDIENGDFVLVRFQEDADNEDIVVAEIVGIDEIATLKRFLREEDKVTLYPETLVKGYRSHSFTLQSERFYIRGKVLAVFKSTTLLGEKFNVRTKLERERYNYLCLITTNVVNGRDSDRAWRLIYVESKRNPSARLIDWIEAAIYKVQQSK